MCRGSWFGYAGIRTRYLKSECGEDASGLSLFLRNIRNLQIFRLKDEKVSLG